MRELDRLSVHQLRVLLILLEEGNVSGAARRLGVTQPALSHSLRALRDNLGDPLLVMGARGMALTPRAAALAGPLRRALRELEQALSGGASFEPATTRRTFVLATWDGVTITLLPRVLARIRAEAPGLELDVRPVPREGSASGLEDGALDLAIEVTPRDRPGLKQRKLYEDEFVCLVRAGHPEVGETLDLETFLRLPHALISPQGEGTGVVDRQLAAIGRSRHIAMRIRYFLAAPLIVAQSDLIVSAPRSIAEALLPLAPLRLFAPPLPLPGFTVALVWHGRADLDPAHRWLRDTIVDAPRR